MTTPYFNAKDACVCCQESVKNTRYFVCLKCDENYRICKPCFAAGADVGSHRPDHPYRVVDNETYPIFLPPVDASGEAQPGPSRPCLWTAEEELRLLRAMDQYQYGNWVDVASHVKSRNPQECEDHYVQCYLNGNLGEKTWTWAAKDPGNEQLGITDHTVVLGDVKFEENDMTVLPEPKITDAQAQQLGFLRNRQDFEIEYDNGAEGLISTLEFSSNDDSNTEFMKLLKIDSYYRVQCERDLMRRVALEYHLPEAFFGNKPEKKSLTSCTGVTQQRKWKLREAEISRRCKWMARFFRASMLDAFQVMLLQEEILRDYVEQNLRVDCEDLMAEFNVELDDKLAVRKRTQSCSEAGPSGALKLRTNKYPASASKAEKVIPVTPTRKRGGRVCVGRRPSTRNISAALDLAPAEEDEDGVCSGLDGSQDFLDSGSSYESGSSNSSTGSERKVKRRRKNKRFTRKKSCSLKRPHVCPVHPAPPGYFVNA